MLLFVLILALSLHPNGGSSSSAIGKPYDTPSTCLKPRECPRYTVVARDVEKDLEVRLYHAAKFAVAKLQEGESYRAAVVTGFKQLFSYFGGANDRKQKIPMTAPAITTISRRRGNSSSHVTHFYLPKAVQKDPPLAQGIKIVHWTSGTKMAAVRRYPGFNDDTTIARELAALRASLKGGLWDVHRKSKDYTVAGYNRPTVLHNRTNEVMIIFGSYFN